MFTKPKEQTVQQISKQINRVIQHTFTSEEILAVILHGSVIKGGFIEHFSDVDVQVFLTPKSFDKYGLLLEKSLSLQEQLGKIDLSKIKAYYLQLSCYTPKLIPEWYVPPLEGSYQVILGSTPASLKCSVKRRFSNMRKTLNTIDQSISRMLASFTDSPNTTLFRQVRLLATVVNPLVYSYVALHSSMRETIWAKPKDRVYQLFYELETPLLQKAIINLQTFMESIGHLAKKQDDFSAARESYKFGMTFLREFDTILKIRIEED